MRFVPVAIALLLWCDLGLAQTDFQVTGTPIPANLLQQNYGAIPKGVAAYDLNICNVSQAKQSLVSSMVYQAIAGAGASIEPIGRDIMLAAIVRNQTHSLSNVLSVALGSTTGVLSILNATRYRMAPGLMTGLALGSMTGQQVLNSLKPILSADQVEKFEAQVLEPALVLDGGSCVERTVFVISSANSKGKADAKYAAEPLSFHIH